MHFCEKIVFGFDPNLGIYLMQHMLGQQRKTDYLRQGKLLVKLTLVFYELLKRMNFVMEIAYVKLFVYWYKILGLFSNILVYDCSTYAESHLNALCVFIEVQLYRCICQLQLKSY